MMYILWRYILKEHIGPFLFAFFIITFVLIIDFLPHVIDLIIGKDLSTWTVIKLFVLNLAWILALSIPMSVLVGTMMAFGRMGSDNEILAIKSSGIHIMQLMMPVIIMGLLLAGALVWFNNNVLPEANHAASTLRGNIQRMRPTLRLQKGIFIDYIPGYIILVDDIDHATSRIKGVVIYEQKNPRLKKTIVADSGTIKFSAQGEFITFNLKSGQVHEENLDETGSYRLSEFAEQQFVINDLGTKLEETERSYRGDREMSASQMREKTNGWYKEIAEYKSLVTNDTDSSVKMILSGAAGMTGYEEATSEELNRQAIGRAHMEHRRLSRLLATRISQIKSNIKLISKYEVEIHKKYSLPAACLAFVLIGGPLGVMGRRGGMAVSVGISIGLFTVYWAFLIGGEQLADRLIIPAWVAMWAANILMSMIGLVLLYQVSQEMTLLTTLRRLFWRRKS